MFGLTRANRVDDFFDFQRDIERLFNQFWSEMPARTGSLRSLAHLRAPKKPRPNSADHFGSCSLVTTGERATGLEPATSSLGSWHSTN